MKNIRTISIYFIMFLLGIFVSCEDWLKVGAQDETTEDDAFASTKGYRSALVGVYKLVASENLWGQELTWGLLSSMSWNYQANYAIPKYRSILQKDNYTSDSRVTTIIENIWGTAFNAIANCNNLLKQIKNVDPNEFEYIWEKDMIMAEARGLRALLHFEMLRLFAPAPITGYTGTAIPYVTEYPTLHPKHKTINEVLNAILEDLKYAQSTLKSIDIEQREEATWIVNTNRMDNMDYYLFQAVLNLNSDGTREGNGDGFFAYRGFRFNYWGATGLLARVYSYMRNYTEAELYADSLLNNWTNTYQFSLYSKNPKASSNPNALDTKRRPEPLIAFWNNDVCDDYKTEITTTYNRIVSLTSLFEGDESNDYRYTDLYNSSNYRYRVWDGQSEDYSINSTIQKYSNPLIPVLELSEIFFIKAECLATRGKIEEAIAVLKNVRDARGCTRLLSATDYDSFMPLLVNEAERDFITRGQSWHFLKKLNWPKIYDGTPAYKTVPEDWYVLPIPDSETAYY